MRSEKYLATEILGMLIAHVRSSYCIAPHQPLAQQLSPAVLDAILDLLASSSGESRSKSARAASVLPGLRHGVRQLALALVDRGYLSGERGQAILTAALGRWPQQVPRQVLALVSRIALQDAARAQLEGADSPSVLQLWDTWLAALASSLESSTRVPDPVDVAEGQHAADSDSGPESVLNREMGRLSPAKGPRARQRSGSQLERARVASCLFSTLTEEHKTALLLRTVDLFVRHAETYGRGAPSGSMCTVLALLHSMMSCFWEPSDRLVSSVETFLCSPELSADGSNPHDEWGVASVERLLRTTINQADASAASKRRDGASDARKHELEVLDLTWDAAPGRELGPAAIDAAVVKLLGKVEGDAKCDKAMVLLEAAHALAERVFSADALGYRDLVAAGSLLHAVRQFTHCLHEAALAAGLQPAHGFSRSSLPVALAPDLRSLVELRARFRRWATGEGGAPEQRDLVEAIDLMSKCFSATSSPYEAHAALVCIDSLLALQKVLLSGGRRDVHGTLGETPAQGAGKNGVEPDEGEKQQLLEDIEGVLGAVQNCMSLVLSCGWWGSASSLLDETASSQIRGAALTAGLPVDMAATDSQGHAQVRDSDVLTIRRAAEDFSRRVPRDTLAVDQQPPILFAEWDAEVQATLLVCFCARNSGTAGQVQSAVRVVCRLVELMAVLCSKLAAMREENASVEAALAAGRDSSALDNSMERLLVIAADVATDQRLKFAHKECEGLLSSHTASGDSRQQLKDLSNLRRVDTFLQAIGGRKLQLARPDAPTSINGILEYCISSVHELACDSKRSTAMVMFYLDSSADKSPLATIPIHCIDEALPEGMHGKGNIAALFDLLRLSADSHILRDVLRFFRTILDKPSSAALARLKPLVRRNVAESLAVMKRGDLRALLGKLLLYKGMDATCPPVGAAAGAATEGAPAVGKAASANAVAATSEPVSDVGAEGLVCCRPEATNQRRSTLRLLTLILDGVDESIDRFAGVLVEVLCRALPHCYSDY